MKLIETAPGSTLDAVAPGGRLDDAATAVLQFDERALDRLRQLDPSGRSRLIERVFDAFESSMQRLLPQLAAGLADTPAGFAAQVRGLRLVAHTLKSSAATVGALSMARQCGELEVLLHDGQTAGIDRRIAALLTETVRVRTAMRAWKEGRPA